MTDQQFDEFFKNKLSVHALPVREEVWQKIVAEKERKRRLLIWLPLAAALLILGAGYFLITPITKKQRIAADKHLPIKVKEELKYGYKPDQQHNTATSKQPVIINNKINEKNTSQVEKVDTTSKELNKTFYAQHKTGKQSLPANNNNPEPAKTFLNSAEANKQDDLEQKETMAGQKNPDQNKEESTKQVTASSVDSVKQADVVASFDSAKSAKAIIKPFQNKIKRWSIEIYAAPEYAFQSLTVNNEKTNSVTFDNSKNLVELKKKSETFVTSFTAGVKVVRRLNKNFSVKTGIEYRQINAKFSYPSYLNAAQNFPQSYLNNLDYYSISGANSNLNLYAQPYQNKQTYTLYKSLSVPVLIGYEKAKRKFSIGVTAGPVFTINRSYSGYNINSSNLQRGLTSTDEPYKKNTGISMYAGLSFIKPFGKKFEIFAEPHLQYSLSNMVKNNAVFNQKIHNAGVAVGVRFPLR